MKASLLSTMLLGNFIFHLSVIYLQSASAQRDWNECEKRDLCEIVQILRDEVVTNTEQRNQWSTHYDFVKSLKILHDRKEEEGNRRSTPNQGYISAVEAKVRRTEERADELELALERERKDRREFENQSRKDHVSYETKKQVLQDKISEVETRLATVEEKFTRDRKAMDKLMSDVIRIRRKSGGNFTMRLRGVENEMEKLENEIGRERNGRKKTESDVSKLRRSLRALSGEDYASEFTTQELGNEVKRLVGEFAQEEKKRQDLEAVVGQIGVEVQDLKRDCSENEINKVKEDITQVQKKIAKIKKAFIKNQMSTMIIAMVLMSTTPSPVLSGLIEEFREVLKISDDSFANIESWIERKTAKPVFPEDGFSSELKAEMTSKIQDMEEKMKVMNASLEKAMSSIEYLESKGKGSWNSDDWGYGPELTEPHERTGERRPFDVHRDP